MRKERSENRMKRVVIIEDENLVLMGIVSLFDQVEGYEVAKTYTNPLKALEELSSLSFDILLTDIKMPQLDGLELIKRVKSEYPSLPVLVLSCLDDFRTVSSAFKLGIQDYLLKHEVEQEILTEKLNAIPLGVPPVSETGVVEDTSFASYLKKLDSQTPAAWAEGLYLYQIIFKRLYDADCEPIQTAINLQWAYRTTENLLAGMGKLCIQGNRDLICIMDAGKKNEQKRKESINRILEVLQSIINNPIIILKSEKSTARELGTTWEKLAARRGCIHYRQRGEIISITSDRCTLDKTAPQLPDPLLIFTKKGLESWREQMGQSIETILLKKTDPDLLAVELVIYWDRLERLYTALYTDQIPFIRVEKILHTVGQYDSTRELLQWYCRTIETLAGDLLSCASVNHTVIQIKIHLHSHYARHITLKSLSEKFNLHEAYLSELFKRESGVGYLEYLTGIRIAEARRLLRESEFTAEQIGQQTGFINASHFSKSFKRHTGVTPTEYRNSPEPLKREQSP